ncbi:MAG: helix-turn-helix domain-containing protein [Candidatus Gracilibacteria bacterium]
MIESFLVKFGLTKNESEIYLFLLEYGESIASMIGKRLGIKRVTVYPALEALIKKNLINSYQKNKVTYFEAVSAEELVDICKRNVAKELELQKHAESILPAFKKLENNRSKPVIELKGKIKYYQGLESVKQLINETLEEGPKEQLCFGLNKYHTDHLWDEWKAYTKKRASIGMNVRSIQPDTKPAREYKKRDKDELRKTKLVPNKKFPAHCELNIIGDMIALFTSHGEQPTGTKIYNKDMAQVLRSLFELAWERANEYDKNKS